jgi:hypothetical protein
MVSQLYSMYGRELKRYQSYAGADKEIKDTQEEINKTLMENHFHII